MANHIYWSIIKKSSCFLLKRNGETFTKEPNNLKGLNRLRYNGLIHDKSLSVEPDKTGRGVVFSYSKPKHMRRPQTFMRRTSHKKHSRHTMQSIKQIIKSQRFRPDLRKAALRRASAIIRSQKPVTLKPRHKKKKD